MTSTKTTNAARWHAISLGHFDEETLEWLRQVGAKMYAAAQEKDGNTRKRLLVEATGIVGRGDALASAIEHVVQNIPPAHQDTVVRTLMLHKDSDDDPGKEARRKRISRARVKLRTKSVQVPSKG